jgi:hypothetical protein
MSTLEVYANTEMATQTELLQDENLQEIAQAPTAYERLKDSFNMFTERVGEVIPRTSLSVAARLAAGMLAITASGEIATSVAEAASVKIVPGKSIDGVSIGQTPAQVMGEIGPAGFTRPPIDGTTVWEYASPVFLTATFSKGHLKGMFTGNQKFRTSKGVGVGSSPEAVKKAYPEAKCTSGAGPGGDKSLACVLKTKSSNGLVETSFEFATQSAGVEDVDIDLL